MNSGASGKGSDSTVAPIAIIGAGPAGLMAAEKLAVDGREVVVFEAMPSPARKLLMAGRGGLNLTHSEPLQGFLARYGKEAPRALIAAIDAFPPDALVAWANWLGQETFAGSSGRIFPKSLKASPLLRAWLRRLDGQGVELRTRQRWVGWDESGSLVFVDEAGQRSTFRASATLLALGGASWPRLGSDGRWVGILSSIGVPIAPIEPANAGVLIAWSEHVIGRHAGEPLKRIAVSFGGVTRRGEAVITRTGLEGGVIYAFTRELRDARGRGEHAGHYARFAPGSGCRRLSAALVRAARQAVCVQFSAQGGWAVAGGNRAAARGRMAVRYLPSPMHWHASSRRYRSRQLAWRVLNAPSLQPAACASMVSTSISC